MNLGSHATHAIGELKNKFFPQTRCQADFCVKYREKKHAVIIGSLDFNRLFFVSCLWGKTGLQVGLKIRRLKCFGSILKPSNPYLKMSSLLCFTYSF